MDPNDPNPDDWLPIVDAAIALCGCDEDDNYFYAFEYEVEKAVNARKLGHILWRGKTLLRWADVEATVHVRL